MMRVRLVFCAFLFMLTNGVFSPAFATENKEIHTISNLFGGSFDLIDQDGKPVTDRSFRGRYMLIYFGYTYCPDICPTGLSTMATALDLLEGKGAKVQPIFVSIDPKRDQPAFLKQYVTAFHPCLIGLTGSEKQVREIAKAYRVHRSKVIEKGKPADEYLVNHSSITYLMGPDGRFLTMFPHGSDPAVIAKAIEKYLS